MRNRVWLHSCRLCISLTFLSIQSTAFEGTFEIKSILILFRENGGARRVSLKADIQSCFPSVKIKFKDSGARYGSRKTLSVHWDWTRRQVGIVERNIWRLQLERIIKLWIGMNEIIPFDVDSRKWQDKIAFTLLPKFHHFKLNLTI